MYITYISKTYIYIYIYTYTHVITSTCTHYYIYTLQSCGYLNKISIKTNVATDEGNRRNET